MDRSSVADALELKPGGAPSLRDVARAAAGGNTEATAKLLRAIAPKLVAIVRAVLGATHPDVDDAAQHALIGFVQALPAYRGDCDPLGYGRVIAVRSAIAVRKRSRSIRARHDDEADLDAMATGHASPKAEVASRQRKEILRELLAELPSEQAETLALRVVLGCSLEEVAEETKAPVNTVRSRIRLAKERLKARIESDPSLLDALGGDEP
ncbi:MAG TPA: sigma-70 family RNA polymerase sigma factor [Labilithrix sp.]|jgi:RNA polymerase sigma-70 factor (ECF subfamily)